MDNYPQPFTSTISASHVGSLTIGINVTDDATTIADQLQAFAEEAMFDSWEDLKQCFADKGWTVTFQYGGTDTSVTYDLRNKERAIPCTIYAKLEEVFMPSEEEMQQAKENKEIIHTPSYDYTSQDGTRFFNVLWYHDSNGTNDEYTLFDSLDHAVEHFNVIPVE